MFKKTAIATAAQIALISANAAWAQTVDTVATTVVVTGQRAALQSAQKLKQNADEVVDSIVAEDIGKLPDRSVTEVLQRVVGVSMDRAVPGDPQHLAVEGSGITIRGMPYVASQLNGRESFSAGGGHSLSFSDVPPELMSGVDVYKNPSAEQIEGGISGLVNLRTAMPFDYKGLKGSIMGSEAYSKLGKGKPVASTSLLLSNRWSTPFGEFGALVDLARSRSNTRNDELIVEPFFPHVNDIVPGKTVWVPRGAQWRSQAYERDRKGDYAAFQWRPTKDVTASLTYFRSRYTENWSETALISQEQNNYTQTVSDATFSPDGVFRSGTIMNDKNGGINYNPDRRVFVRNSSTQDIALNVQWRVNADWTVTNDFQRVKSSTAGLDSDVGTGLLLPRIAFDLTGNRPKFVYSDADIKYTTNPANYYWAFTMEHLDRNVADSKAWKTDVKYAFDDPVLRDIRFGVRLQDLNGVNKNSNPSYNWSGITFPWMIPWQIKNLAYMGDPRFSSGGQLYSPSNFFNGEVKIPGAVFPTDAVARGYPNSYATLHSYHDILCKEAGSTCDSWKPAGFSDDPASVNRQSEQTRSFYTQLRFGFDDFKYPLDGNVGVRYVKTSNDADGYTTFTPSPFTPGDGTVVGANLVPNIPAFAAPQTFHNASSNVLPSLNLRMKMSDQLQFRLAVAKSISRPDFNQLQGYTTLARSINTTTTGGGTTGQPAATTINSVSLSGLGAGNPNLRPISGISEDLTAEWYFAKAGSLTVALFNKDLKDLIVNQSYNYSANDVSGLSHNFVVTAPVNGAKGYARGFEVAYQQYFDFVPDWLKGLGTQASLTWVHAGRQLNTPVNNPWCEGSANESNYTLNFYGCDTNLQSFAGTPMPGVSKKTINLAVMYERGPVQARLAYNWRSRFLLGVNTFNLADVNGKNLNPASADYLKADGQQRWGLPLWQEAYGQLDASFFYNFTDKFRVGVEVTNLNNAIVKQSMQQHIGMMPHAWFMTGPRYQVQAGYSF